MADSDDDLKRRYRELSREEPSSALDAAILAKSRQKLVSDTSFLKRWSVPVSLAAVLMLGVGVSLRMQLEQPGVETSMPVQESAGARSEKPAAIALAPEPAPPSAPAADAATAATAMPETKLARADKKKADRAPIAIERPAPAPVPAQTAPAAAAQGMVAPEAIAVPKERAESRTRESAVAAEAPRLQDLQANTAGFAATTPAKPQAASPAMAPPPPPVIAQAAPAAPPATAAAPMRAKRESESDNASGARPLRKSIAAESEQDRELERIAKLREAGNHVEADKALEEFRKRHPGFRIPDLMWERVKPK